MLIIKLGFGFDKILLNKVKTIPKLKVKLPEKYVNFLLQKRIIFKSVFTGTKTNNKLDNSFRSNYTAIHCRALKSRNKKTKSIL